MTERLSPWPSNSKQGVQGSCTGPVPLIGLGVRPLDREVVGSIPVGVIAIENWKSISWSSLASAL